LCHPEVSGAQPKDLREAVLGLRNTVKRYFVYIMTNRKRTLYIGVTNDLERRVSEHKHRLIPGFTSRYAIDRLVFCEEHGEVKAAIAREKQLKGWLRAKKIALIESTNAGWRDLSRGW
jgi:putative endonuclease